jgi:hypothetical protein
MRFAPLIRPNEDVVVVEGVNRAMHHSHQMTAAVRGAEPPRL